MGKTDKIKNDSLIFAYFWTVVAFKTEGRPLHLKMESFNTSLSIFLTQIHSTDSDSVQ